METQNFDQIKSTIKRLSAETPDYWKKMIKIGIGVGATCAVLRACGIENGLNFSQQINTILNIGISIGASITALSKLTVK